jgi:hypothetical protein
VKAAIFSFVRVSENSMVASVRIARFLSEKMDIPIVADEHISDQRLDLLIIVNGAYGFCKYLEQLGDAVVRAKRIVWVQNDYTIIPPKIESQGISPFRAAFRQRHEAGKPHMDFWTTCEDWARFTPESLYVNWNALTFDEEYDQKVIAKRRRNKNEDLLYYGSFRGGGGKSSREKYFDRYFIDPKVRTVISSPAKQFREKYPSAVHVDIIKNNFFQTLGEFGLGLYIEDRMSHERFHSPANRFYEMLSAGLPMVFQPEAESMMARAGYKIGDYVAHSARAIKGQMDIREEIGRRQREEWIGTNGHRKFRRKLHEQLDAAIQTQMDALA